MTTYTEREKLEALRLMAKAQEKLNADTKARTSAARALIEALVDLNGKFGFTIRLADDSGGMGADVTLPRPTYEQHARPAFVGYKPERGFTIIAGNSQAELTGKIYYDPFAQKFVGSEKKVDSEERYSALTIIVREILKNSGHLDVATDD